MALMNSALHNQPQDLFSPSAMTFKSKRAGFYTNLWNIKKEKEWGWKQPMFLFWLVSSLGYFGPQLQADLWMGRSLAQQAPWVYLRKPIQPLCHHNKDRFFCLFVSSTLDEHIWTLLGVYKQVNWHERCWAFSITAWVCCNAWEHQF